MGSTKILILGAIEAAKSKKTQWVKYCEEPCSMVFLGHFFFQHYYRFDTLNQIAQDYRLCIVMGRDIYSVYHQLEVVSKTTCIPIREHGIMLNRMKLNKSKYT